MAQQTALSPMATPGPTYAFAAKAGAAVSLSTRYALDGTDNTRLALDGTDNTRIALDGTDNTRLTLDGV